MSDVPLQIELPLDTTQTPPYFVTEFRVTREQSMVFLFLSLGHGGQSLVNLLFILAEASFDVNKESTLAYYERYRSQHPEIVPRPPVGYTAMGRPTIYYGHFLDISHYGEMGQIRLVWFSVKRIAEVIRTGQGTIPAFVGCIAEMPMALQLSIIMELYIHQ